MVSRVATVAFEGIEARPVDVQVQVASGAVAFVLVGLPDKAVAESRERVRAALTASGLALPAKRIVVNLAPADLPKEGSHYDLPIALGVMAAIGAIPSDALEGYCVLGELALDGSLSPVAGVLPAAISAQGRSLGLICPRASGPEAAGPARPSTFWPRRTLSRSRTISKARRSCAGRSRPSAKAGGCCPISAISRGRKAPSARWKLQLPAGITC